MKRIKYFTLIIFLLGSAHKMQSQFLKKLMKHAEDKVKREAERRAERRIDRGIDKVYDETENEIDGKNKKKKKKSTEKETASNNKHSNKKIVSKRKRKAKGKNDFVPGDQLVFTDTFKNDAIGDIPVTWNTNSSGEIVGHTDSDGSAVSNL